MVDRVGEVAKRVNATVFRAATGAMRKIVKKMIDCSRHF